MRGALGCLGTLLLPLAFYGSIAIVFLTLILYPFLYAQDVSSANAYRTAPACAGTSTKNCRSIATGRVTEVRSSDNPLDFDAVVGGKTVNVTRDGGTYSPNVGDTVELEMWGGEPVRVTGPDGTQLTTDQYPPSKLKTDQDVLGLFVVGGIFFLFVAVLTGWFGRQIMFARLMGQSRRQVLLGVAIVLLLVVVTVPIALIAPSLGWVPSGRAGGTIIGLVEGGLIVLGAAAYALIRRLRST